MVVVSFIRPIFKYADHKSAFKFFATILQKFQFLTRNIN